MASVRFSVVWELQGRSGNNTSCCSKDELDSLKTRWKSTKTEIYEKRIKGYASIIKSVVDAESLIRAEIVTLSKKQAVKIDCKAAMAEVNKFHDKKNTRDLWSQWQKTAEKCLEHTIKLKIGLFCAICSPQAYTNPPDVFIQGANSKPPILRLNQADCNKFVADCHGFIKAQMNIREYFSAVAALSKCDERGWTDFDQEYLYRPQNETMVQLLTNYSKETDEFIRNSYSSKICQAEYSLSTMLASDLKEKKYWLSFVQNAESIFKKFNIKNDSPKYFYQADDENSVKQDLSEYQVEVNGASTSIMNYTEDGEESMASKKIDPPYIRSLISSSRILSLLVGWIFLVLICSI